MCTLILLQRPDHDWPLLLAANRDEMTDRPWLPPGHHWPGQPDVVAGIDRVGGGSWLGLNSDGLVAAIMNRHLLHWHNSIRRCTRALTWWWPTGARPSGYATMAMQSRAG